MALIGAGTDVDPYRVNFPTYKMVAQDIAQGHAVVDIHEDDVPPTLHGYAWCNVLVPANPMVGGPLPSAMAQEWQSHVDDRYREHAGRFVANQS